MKIDHKDLYKNLSSNEFEKSYALETIISIIEHLDNDEIRKECLELLNKFKINNDKFFKILENLLISDSNKEIRYIAVKILSENFLLKTLRAFEWALKNETSYNCLILIINALEEANSIQARNILIEEIKRTKPPKFRPIININQLDRLSINYLGNILKNYITIKFLKNKFPQLEYKSENGMIIELDLSKINTPITCWRDRCEIQDISEITGIRNLKNLRNLKCFPLTWATQNEFNLECFISLILTLLNKRDKETVKKLFLSNINIMKDEESYSEIKNFVKNPNYQDTFSDTKLAEILINYSILSFLKKKYPQLQYEIQKGVIVALEISDKPIIKIPEFIKHLHLLRTLKLKKCNIYSIPLSIGELKGLEVLNLEDNYLHGLPESIGKLESLRILNLKRNQLKEIPKSIGSLKNLEYLNLEMNCLMRLPSSIGLLFKLNYLNVKSNHLKEIPS
ncbi:MAG: hypothetical protein EU539_10880, partial [Promethearchaeota archaeon]